MTVHDAPNRREVAVDIAERAEEHLTNCELRIVS
jgi:hypothetical protein